MQMHFHYLHSSIQVKCSEVTLKITVQTDVLGKKDLCKGKSLQTLAHLHKEQAELKSHDPQEDTVPKQQLVAELTDQSTSCYNLQTIIKFIKDSRSTTNKITEELGYVCVCLVARGYCESCLPERLQGFICVCCALGEL